jgi:hypothetical protein
MYAYNMVWSSCGVQLVAKLRPFCFTNTNKYMLNMLYNTTCIKMWGAICVVLEPLNLVKRLDGKTVFISNRGLVRPNKNQAPLQNEAHGTSKAWLDGRCAN